MLDELIGSTLSRELIVIIISALPITELRGALPVGIRLFQLPWYQAFFLAVIGNMLPVPFLLLFLQSLFKTIRRTDPGRRLVNSLLRHTRRHSAIVEKYGIIGLMLLVAVPLPGTGAWTGSMVAFLLGLSWHRALLSITVGVLVSGVIVTALSLLGWGGVIIAGVGLVAIVLLGLWKA
ncbi:MAG: small multi-drug export protein [Chloroflexi bacterium]|nr:small multi-drug export protein [Chloroflexota bacterium]